MTKKDIKKDIMAVRDEVHRLQDEAAKNPDHPINDGLKAHFEERKRKLSEIKKSGGVSKSMLKQSRLNFDKIEKCE